MKQAVIDAHNLSKIYDEDSIPVVALDHAQLHLNRGEFTAIKGPSGSGKTTLLNMIGGLDHPSSGYVEINGTNITKLHGNALIDFRLNNIGFVFQSYNLIPVLTAKENIEFIMLLQKIPKLGQRLVAYSWNNSVVYVMVIAISTKIQTLLPIRKEKN